jgi:hypothetical protein
MAVVLTRMLILLEIAMVALVIIKQKIALMKVIMKL